MMRKALLLITTVIVLAGVNVQIAQKERLLQQGVTMLLRLAPVDPRSLIQGDYMDLRYDLPEFLRQPSLPRNGHVVVSNSRSLMKCLHSGHFEIDRS